MVNVSKKALRKSVAARIHSRFVSSLIKLEGGRGEHFLEELFTPAEQVMIAKRLSALFLLSQGFSAYKVRKMLKLSPSTTSRLQHEIKNGMYKTITGVGKTNKERTEIFADIEVLIRMGMPEMGRGRWKWLDKI